MNSGRIHQHKKCGAANTDTQERASLRKSSYWNLRAINGWYFFEYRRWQISGLWGLHPQYQSKKL